MKNSIKNICCLIFTLFVFLSCQDSLKKSKHNLTTKDSQKATKINSKYIDEYGRIKISELNVREFLSLLTFENDKKNDLNIVTTVGETSPDWLTDDDLEYLILKIESDEKAKCIKRMISSYIPTSKNMTLGNQAISIIESYRKKELYPNKLYICETYDKEKVTEILEWWKQKER